MKPRTGFARWVNNVRALWKWLDLDELLFGLFLGVVLTNLGWTLWSGAHTH